MQQRSISEWEDGGRSGRLAIVDEPDIARHHDGVARQNPQAMLLRVPGGTQVAYRPCTIIQLAQGVAIIKLVCKQPKQVEVGECRCDPPPELEWGPASIGMCGSSVVDMDSGCHGLSPQHVRDLSISKHGSSHVDDHAIEALSNAIELQHVQGRWLMGNAMLFKVHLELAAHVLATIV